MSEIDMELTSDNSDFFQSASFTLDVMKEWERDGSESLIGYAIQMSAYKCVPVLIKFCRNLNVDINETKMCELAHEEKMMDILISFGFSIQSDSVYKSCIENNQVWKMKLLLDHGMDASGPNDDSSGLSFSLSHRFLSMTDLLLSRGCRWHNQSPESPVYVAVRTGRANFELFDKHGCLDNLSEKEFKDCVLESCTAKQYVAFQNLISRRACIEFLIEDPAVISSVVIAGGYFVCLLLKQARRSHLPHRFESIRQISPRYEATAKLLISLCYFEDGSTVSVPHSLFSYISSNQVDKTIQMLETDGKEINVPSSYSIDSVCHGKHLKMLEILLDFFGDELTFSTEVFREGLEECVEMLLSRQSLHLLHVKEKWKKLFMEALICSNISSVSMLLVYKSVQFTFESGDLYVIEQAFWANRNIYILEMLFRHVIQLRRNHSDDTYTIVGRQTKIRVRDSVTFGKIFNECKPLK